MSSNEIQTASGGGNSNTGGNNSGNDASTQGSTNENNSGSNNVSGRINYNNRRSDNRRNLFSENEHTWCGDNPDIGAVLGLRTEYLDKKVSHRVFVEKMI